MHLATGGMAQIYLAKAGGIGQFERYVVLKTILPDRADDTRFVSMFLDEARLAATLNHQNIAQVYEVDEADGAYFMAMEYVHGENVRLLLETTLKRGWTIPIELGVAIISGAAAGLHHAHERRGKGGAPLNIVHRDVSPANIMVGYDGAVKVLDFGIAKAEERSTRTQQGTIKGKYGYMSPEQCRGKPVDRRSDIFALGIVLYELTTLRRAFRGNDDFDTMKRIVSGDITPPSVAVPGYPRELESIVLTAMARDPEFRFQTAQEMLEALDAFMVRARLAASPTALGRYMTQLFGAKREPWVERSKNSVAPPLADTGEATEISVAKDLDEPPAMEPPHERTALLTDAGLAAANEPASDTRGRLGADTAGPPQDQITVENPMGRAIRPPGAPAAAPMPMAARPPARAPQPPPTRPAGPDVAAWAAPDGGEPARRVSGPLPALGATGMTPPPGALAATGTAPGAGRLPTPPPVPPASLAPPMLPTPTSYAIKPSRSGLVVAILVTLSAVIGGIIAASVMG
ncbi:MAG: serine/threonine-protein kinase [Kofleriaceae bacterium]